MTHRKISIRAGWFSAGAIIIVALGALAVGGLRGVAVRTYALRAPNQFPLVTLGHAHTVCEGPVSSSQPVRSVAIWGAASGDRATLRLTVRVPGRGRILATGTTTARNAEGEQRVSLNTPVAGATPVRICVTGNQGRFSIAGSPAVNPGVVMTGKPADREFSLLLLSGRQSFFSALPIAFSRAALFRPEWVGTWTFWVLASGLLAAFALALLAVVRALEADVNGDIDRRAADAAPAEQRAGPPPR